jgi:hypothetical protein
MKKMLINFFIELKSIEYSTKLKKTEIKTSCNTFFGEQQYCRNQLLDKVPKTILGHYAEKILENLQLSKKCRFSFQT